MNYIALWAALRGSPSATPPPSPPPPPPSPPPPPPPPPPAAPSTNTIRMTGTGTAFNGPCYYLGFTVVSGSGAVRVYNGPDATFPLVHEELTPTTTHYAPGVNPSDSATWIRLQTMWVTHGGTETIDYIISETV